MAGAASAVAALLSLGACSGNGDDASGAPATTTTSPRATSTASSADEPVTNWDGVRFDLGVVAGIDRTEGGRTLVRFDRVQLHEGTEPTDAGDFTEEPIVVGNTDAPFLNENSRLRTYEAAADVEVLRVANLRRTCSDLEDREEPRWERVTVDDAVRQALWEEFRQVSLTFDPSGRVTRIRFAASC